MYLPLRFFSHFKQIILPIYLFCLVQPIFSKIYYVNHSINGNGTSWSNAFSSIQQAIDTAQAGDSIFISAGIYKPTNDTNRAASFVLKSDIQLYGGFSEIGNPEFTDRNWEINKTILSGDIGIPYDSIDNSRNIVTGSFLGQNTIFDGFYIENSFDGSSIKLEAKSGDTCSAIIRNLKISNNRAVGGGIYNNGGGLTCYAESSGVIEAEFSNIVFEGNRASLGGAAYLYCKGGGLNRSIYRNLRINNNTAFRGAGIYLISGGATSIMEPDFNDIEITNNSSTHTGGAIELILDRNGVVKPVFNNAIINGNEAARYGGVIYANVDNPYSGDKVIDPIFSNATITNNTALTGAILNIYYDRNIHSEPESAKRALLEYNINFKYCLIANNTALSSKLFSVDAGGIGNVFINIENSTITKNYSARNLSTTNNNKINFTSSIYWNNSNLSINNGYLNAQYSCIENFRIDLTNINLPPRFNDPDNNDFTLSDYSPCIETGKNNVDMGVFPYTGVAKDPMDTLIVYIKNNATGNNDGTSWTDAFTSLNDALKYAFKGNQIEYENLQFWVAAGIYTATSDTTRMKSFKLKSNVQIYGGFIGNETALDQRNFKVNKTFISGDIGIINDQTDNTFNIVIAENVNSSAVLDGFHIVNAGNKTSYGYGGAISCISRSGKCNPIFRNLEIYNNGTLNGQNNNYAGAVSCNSIEANSYCSPQFDSISIHHNYGYYVGGIYIDNGSGDNNICEPRLSNILMHSNYGNDYRSLVISGDSICNPTIDHATIVEGETDTIGNLVSFRGANTEISNSIIWGEQNSGIETINANPIINWSCIPGGYPGTNNISKNPRFTSASLLDYSLSPYSPCINSASYFSDMGAIPFNDTAKTPTGLKIIYVNQNATGLNNGETWTNAYTNLQDALYSIGSEQWNKFESCQIWVAKGVYKPTNDTTRDAKFYIKTSTKLFGGFSGTETNLTQRNFNTNETILSGDIGVQNDSSDNSQNILYMENVDSTTEINGFTISNAYNKYSYGCAISCLAEGSGSNCLPTFKNLTVKNNCAIYTSSAFRSIIDLRGPQFFPSRPDPLSYCIPTFDSCTIIDNYGTGIFHSNATSIVMNSAIENNYRGLYYSASSNPSNYSTVTNVNIKNNYIDGGLHSSGASIHFKDVLISNNHSTKHGGGLKLAFSNIYQPDDPDQTIPLIFENVEISNNSADSMGGGIYIDHGNKKTIAYAPLYNLKIMNNRALDGGGIYVYDKWDNSLWGRLNLELKDVYMSGNSATNDGGAIHFMVSRYSFSANRCIFEKNKAGKAGGAICSKRHRSSSDQSITKFEVINSLISTNESDTGGAFSMQLPGINFNFFNSTITNNISNHIGGIYFYPNTILNKIDCDINNTVFWGNKNGNLELASNINMNFANCAMEGGFGDSLTVLNLQSENTGSNTALLYPEFKDPANSDFRLTENSGLIDYGNKDSLLPGMENDLAGNTRVFNNYVDIGAYEFIDTTSNLHISKVFPQEIDEDESIEINNSMLVISNPNNSKLNIVIHEGANYSILNNTISPTPNFYGNIFVSVQVQDSLNISNLKTIPITINSVNDRPQITTQASDETISPDIEYLKSFNAIDIENDILSWSLHNAPNQMSIDASTGILRWTPTISDTGTYLISVVVNDYSLSDTISFQLNVDIPTSNQDITLFNEHKNQLFQAYPNPEDTDNEILFILNVKAYLDIRMNILDYLGDAVFTYSGKIYNSKQPFTSWDLKNKSGIKVAKGAYYVNLTVKDINTQSIQKCKILIGVKN